MANIDRKNHGYIYGKPYGSSRSPPLIYSKGHENLTDVMSCSLTSKLSKYSFIGRWLNSFWKFETRDEEVDDKYFMKYYDIIASYCMNPTENWAYSLQTNRETREYLKLMIFKDGISDIYGR